MRSSSAPPPSCRAHSLDVGEYGAGKAQIGADPRARHRARPDAAISKARCMLGRNRLHMASIRKSFLFPGKRRRARRLPGR